MKKAKNQEAEKRRRSAKKGKDREQTKLIEDKEGAIISGNTTRERRKRK